MPEFEGVADTTIQLGDAFDPMAGVKATDAEDGDLTDQVRVEGSVDVNVLGVYDLVYRVTDSANQTTTAQRSVIVSDGSSYPPYESGKRMKQVTLSQVQMATCINVNHGHTRAGVQTLLMRQVKPFTGQTLGISCN